MTLQARMPRSSTTHLAAFAIVLLLLLLVPLVGPAYYTVLAFQILMFLALAASWNLITGFTGYLSFGHVVYFGAGAYTAAILITTYKVHWIAALAAGGATAGVLALLLGLVCLRLRGHYFSICTFGLNEVVRVGVLLAEPVTRGAAGISLPVTESDYSTYVAMAVTAAASVFITYWIVNSNVGLRLMAMRDDEDAARVYGVPTIRLKVGMLLLSAVLAGIVGAIYARNIGFVEPNTVFMPLFSVQMIVFALFGGRGTVLGPVVGTVFLFLLWEFLWVKFPYLHLLAFGILLVAVVLYMPRGVIGVLVDKGFGFFEMKIPLRERLGRGPRGPLAARPLPSAPGGGDR